MFPFFGGRTLLGRVVQHQRKNQHTAPSGKVRGILSLQMTCIYVRPRSYRSSLAGF